MRLTPLEIQYGFRHRLAKPPKPLRTVVEVAQLNGEDTITIHCTQLGDSSTPQYRTPAQKKRVLTEWCDFLKNHPDTFTELDFCSRMPQELFDAVCCQRRLTRLEIKWGVYQDIGAITRLTQLQRLHIGSGAGVQRIEPLAQLQNLAALSIENFQTITDYSPLAHLTQLESLGIDGNGLAPQYIHIQSLDFLAQMPQLRYLSLLTARLHSKDFSPILHLHNLEHLTLPTKNSAKGLYPQLARLPKLTWGLVKTNPELYAQ